MRITNYRSPCFKRRLKDNEIDDYMQTYRQARSKVAGGKFGKNMLIIPVVSLPQYSQNNTGVGNLNSEESSKFFNFVKKYWDINEIQLLPVGQYHNINGEYPVYSGTSMDFGVHMIDVQSLLSNEKFEKLVASNGYGDKVNFANAADYNSMQEQLLKEYFKNLPDNIRENFEKYKAKNFERLQKKAIYRALSTKYNSGNYNKWSKIDSELFNEDVVPHSLREKRIKEILKNNQFDADFYIFEQFLAEKDFTKAKRNLNSKGIKVSADMLCGFSNDEVWANPKAFIKNSNIEWGLPALDFSSPEAEKLLREKVRFYSTFFDGFRVDAAWTYVEPRVKNRATNNTVSFDYGDKFIRIIEDEAKKIKGQNFDLNNITYEFAASQNDFNIYNGPFLKASAKDRCKIYTSDYLSENWGSAKHFIEQKWSQDEFILGVSNHDSDEIKYIEKQGDVLSKILKIPKDKIQKEFLNAKFAEPMSAENIMLFFMTALGIKGKYKDNTDKSKNYTAKIHENFEDNYIKALRKNDAFNPMDAFEKQFIAKGLDKTDAELFNKIKKYRKILQKSDGIPAKILAAVSMGAAALILIIANTFNKKSNQHQSDSCL